MGDRRGSCFGQNIIDLILISTNEIQCIIIDWSTSVHSKGSPASAKKKGKEARRWDNAGTAQEGKSLDYSSSNGNQANENDDDEEDLENLVRHCVRDIYPWKGGILFKVLAEGAEEALPWGPAHYLFVHHFDSIPLIE